jgi:multiple sugar transport system substrate-binding protein
LLGIAALFLAGCNLPGSEPTPLPGAPTNTPLPSQPTPVSTNAAVSTPSTPAVITLTIWTTESFSPTQAITSGQVLAQQAAAFEEERPDARLEFILKKPYGKGGVLDYLLTTAAVVPDLLPDLAFLDVDELEAAVQAGVVQPLDELIPADLAADLYPFALESATFGGRLYGLQFQADLNHLVYSTAKLTVPPRSWPGVLSNPGEYVFPAGGRGGLVNDDFLTQYLAVRTWPSEGDAGESFLEMESLTAVLQFYQDGVSRGVFPPEILDYQRTDDCWQDYLAGTAALAHVSAHRYLEERSRSQTSAVAPIPVINGAGSAISRGWVLVLVATDPARQSLAVEFMIRLMSPEVNAVWNQTAGYLPTRQSVLADHDDGDSYIRFVDQQLQAARARPRLPNYAQVAAALQEAVEDVITGAATPEEAAARAVESVQ